MTSRATYDEAMEYAVEGGATLLLEETVEELAYYLNEGDLDFMLKEVKRIVRDVMEKSFICGFATAEGEGEL